jgi:tetratricopeptide (TPR) repeat protein
MEKEWEVFKDALENRTGLPRTIVSIILELVTPLIVFLCVRVILEPLDLEPPSAQLIPAFLAAALFWLVITHYLAKQPFWLAVLVDIVLFVFCVAFLKLWVLYHTRVGGVVSLRVPLFVMAAALLCNLVMLQAHARFLRRLAARAAWALSRIQVYASNAETQWHQRVARVGLAFCSVGLAICGVLLGWARRIAGVYAVTPKADWRLWIARGVGLAICAALLIGAIVRAENWYLVMNTLFGPHVDDQRVGILLAPYNNDPKDTARARLREDLSELLETTPVLAMQAQILPLPRLVPGYRPEAPAEQAEAAQLIGAYDRGTAVIYGAVAGEQAGYLVKTRIRLINPPPFLREALAVSRIDVGPPTNDARIVHVEAAMVAGSTALTLGQCEAAEHLFDEAASVRHNLPAHPESIPGKGEPGLLSESEIGYWGATSIDCQISNGALVPQESVARALQLLDAIPADPTSSIDMRVQAASGQAHIHRDLAERTGDSAGVRRELQLAIDAYTRALAAPPQGYGGIFVASARNSRGVTRVESERFIVRENIAERRAILTSAREDYAAAVMILNQQVPADRAASRSDRRYLSSSININLGVVTFRLGVIDDAPDRITEAIWLYRALLSDIAETPRLEPQLRSNIGDALFTLAHYRDATANYRAARDELERSLAASANARPLVVADLVGKLGYVDISLARIGADPAAQRRGIASLVCAARLARAAGMNREADSIQADIADERQHLSSNEYSEALSVRAPFKVCQAT